MLVPRAFELVSEVTAENDQTVDQGGFGEEARLTQRDKSSSEEGPISVFLF